MNPRIRRLLIRSVVVALILGLIGYGYARVMMIVLQNNADPRPEHDELIWRIPLSLAVMGVLTLLVMEGIVALIRRGKSAGKDG